MVFAPLFQWLPVQFFPTSHEWEWDDQCANDYETIYSGIQRTGSLSFGTFQTGIIGMYEGREMERESGKKSGKMSKFQTSWWNLL